MNKTQISVEEAKLTNDVPGFLMKIQTSSCELNMWLKSDEIPMLNQVRSARWENRTSLQIGRSAGSPVFWSSQDESLSIIVGQDDETWDIALTLPISILDEIVSAIEPLSPER